MDRDHERRLVPQDLPPVSLRIDGRVHMVNQAYAEAMETRRRREATSGAVAERRREAAIALAHRASSGGTGLSSGRRPKNVKPVNAPRIRQSSMYSDRPRRSRGNREPAQLGTSSLLEEDNNDLNSNNGGPAISDISKIQMLSITDPVRALDSTYSLSSGRRHKNVKPVDAPRIRQSSMYSDRPRRSRGNREPTQLGTSSLDSGGDLHDTTIVAPSVTEDAEFWSQKAREVKEYLDKHTFDSWEAIREYWYANGIAKRREAEAGDDEAISEEYSPKSSHERPSELGKWVPAPEKYSKQQIVQNGMKWMREEVMVAFENYFGRQDDLKGYDYKLDELQCQCFNVEDYNHTFHHFNLMDVRTKG